jgi:anthranilate synthase component 2
VKILVVDFYDSFTYNLVHYLEALDCTVTIAKDDKVNLEGLSSFNAVVLSPGPGIPEEKINLFRILEICQAKIPVLGICLGMQGIAVYLNLVLENQLEVKHGVSEKIKILDKKGLFKEIPSIIDVGLYHSWKVNSALIENITAISESNVIMAIEFPKYKMYGVQFHPESIMTPFGKKIVENFLSLC